MADVWRFAVIADTRGDSSSTPANPWVNSTVLTAMATAIRNDGAELVLVAGDLIYGDPISSHGTNFAAQYDIWTNAMAPIYRAGIRVYPVRGTHESYGDSAMGTAFQTVFSNDIPRNGPAGEEGLTYSFTYKNVFFVGLDQFRNPHRVNQAWLTDQLADNTKPHVFAFGHEPAVQVNTSNCLAQFRAERDEFLDSLIDAGSRIYFCGHDHFYDHAIVTEGRNRAIRQMVVGSGGAPPRGWSGIYGAAFGESNMAVNVRHVGYTNGYAMVTISNYTVTIEWKGSSNLAYWQTFDRFKYSLPNPALRRINDYDGDSKSDPAVYNEETGAWTVLFSSQSYVPGLDPILGSRGWRPAPGDYDGDNLTDPAVMSQSGTWWILLSGSEYTPVSTNLGWQGTGPASSDYDGDGITDIACYEKSSGSWNIMLSGSDYRVFTAIVGGPGYVPVPADYDGDGCADLCVYNESTAEWRAALSSFGYQEVAVSWGGPGYQAVPADYDNDGQVDLCIYNRATGEWNALLSSCAYAQYAYVYWGNAASKPAPGDYDGDGRADPCIYAKSIPDWAVMLSGSSYLGASLAFGGTNWTEVSSLWREDLVFLAFGDSITYGGGSSSNGPATGYPVLLETKLKEYFDGYFLSVNRGNPGEDTYEGFERFARTLDETDPDLVLLMEGTNDNFYGTPYDEIQENLSNMIRIALGRGIPVIIATIPPVITNEYRDRTAQAARIAGFNPRIYTIAAEFNIPVAQVYEAITSVPGWPSSLMDQPSANHPNDAGYRVVRDAFYAPVRAGIDAGQY